VCGARNVDLGAGVMHSGCDNRHHLWCLWGGLVDFRLWRLWSSPNTGVTGLRLPSEIFSALLAMGDTAAEWEVPLGTWDRR